MLLRTFWLIASFFGFAIGPLLGAEDWTQLKVGMSPDEAMEFLGDPLMKTSGNGFELWIYDNNAEAVFYGGPLIGWTTPAKGKTKGKTVDVWQRKPGAPNTPSFVLPRATPYRTRGLDRRQDGASEGAYKLPLYRLQN